MHWPTSRRARRSVLSAIQWWQRRRCQCHSVGSVNQLSVQSMSPLMYACDHFLGSAKRGNRETLGWFPPWRTSRRRCRLYMTQSTGIMASRMHMQPRLFPASALIKPDFLFVDLIWILARDLRQPFRSSFGKPVTMTNISYRHPTYSYSTSLSSCSYFHLLSVYTLYILRSLFQVAGSSASRPWGTVATKFDGILPSTRK